MARDELQMINYDKYPAFKVPDEEREQVEQSPLYRALHANKTVEDTLKEMKALLEEGETPTRHVLTAAIALGYVDRELFADLMDRCDDLYKVCWPHWG